MTPFLKATWNWWMGILFSPLHGKGSADLSDCYTTGMRGGKEITKLLPQQTAEDSSASVPFIVRGRATGPLGLICRRVAKGKTKDLFEQNATG